MKTPNSLVANSLVREMPSLSCSHLGEERDAGRHQSKIAIGACSVPVSGDLPDRIPGAEWRTRCLTVAFFVASRRMESTAELK